MISVLPACQIAEPLQDRPFRLTSIASGLEEDEKPWGWDMLNEDEFVLEPAPG